MKSWRYRPAGGPQPPPPGVRMRVDGDIHVSFGKDLVFMPEPLATLLRQLPWRRQVGRSPLDSFEVLAPYPDHPADLVGPEAPRVDHPVELLERDPQDDRRLLDCKPYLFITIRHIPEVTVLMRHCSQRVEE